MRQIDFFCNVASAQATSSLTGAFQLPAWAPDIAWMTTSASNMMPLLVATANPAGGTTLIQIIESASLVHSARAFAIRACPLAAVGRVVLTYEAVGDLVRT